MRRTVTDGTRARRRGDEGDAQSTKATPNEAFSASAPAATGPMIGADVGGHLEPRERGAARSGASPTRSATAAPCAGWSRPAPAPATAEAREQHDEARDAGQRGQGSEAVPTA